MEHLQVDRIMQYVAHKLIDAECIAIETHLADCDDCARRIRSHYLLRDHFDEIWDKWTEGMEEDAWIPVAEHVLAAAARAGMTEGARQRLARAIETIPKKTRAALAAGLASFREAGRTLQQNLEDYFQPIAATTEGLGFIAQPTGAAVLVSGSVGGKPPARDMLSFTQQGSMLFSYVHESNALFLYEMPSGRLHRSIQAEGDTTLVGVSPNGKFLATSSDENLLSLWDLEEGRCIHKELEQEEGVTAIAFHPAGHLVATGSSAGTTYLWDVATGSIIQSLSGHAASVSAVAFSPDGSRIASGSADQTVRIWDAAIGMLILSLEGHKEPIKALAWSPDGCRIASGAHDGKVLIWDAYTGQLLCTLEGTTASVSALAWSPDNTALAGAYWDGTLVLWDTGSGDRVRTVQHIPGGVSAVAMSPDGGMLAFANPMGMVSLHDCRSGQLLQTLVGQQYHLISPGQEGDLPITILADPHSDYISVESSQPPGPAPRALLIPLAEGEAIETSFHSPTAGVFRADFSDVPSGEYLVTIITTK